MGSSSICKDGSFSARIFASSYLHKKCIGVSSCSPIHPYSYGLNIVSEHQEPPAMNSLEQFESKTDLIKLELPNKSTSDDFNYVRNILEHSGFKKNTLQETWHAVDPSLYEEVAEEEGGYCNNHLLLFDLINEVLMEIYDRSFWYCPIPFSSPLMYIRPMPVGNRVVEEVWMSISWYLSSRPGLDQLSDYFVSRDLSKGDGWMNLQFDTECAGLEMEDLIFDHLLDEVVYDCACVRRCLW